MASWLELVFLNNTIKDYLILLVAVMLILLCKRYLSDYLAGLFFRLFNKTSSKISRDLFVHLVRGPIHVFLVLLVLFLALDRMQFPEAVNFKIHRISTRQIMESLINAILIIAFIWLLLRLIDFIAMVIEQKADRQNGSSNQIIVFFKDFLKVIIIFIGILLVIRFTFQKDIAPLLAGFGIVGAALALSARESLENLIASFIIFFDKPFSQGDLVKIQNFTGTVERIGLRSTRIRTDQKTYVTVPNKQMVDSILDNFSLRTQRRGFLSLELNSSTPFETVNQLVTAIDSLVAARKTNIEDYSVVLSDISKNSFVIQVEYFTGPVAMEIYNEVKQELNLSVIQIMDEMKIRLAGKETEVILTTG